MKIMRKGACMRREEITRYFLKELETFPVPYENVSGLSELESQEWIITCWDKSRVFVKLLCDGDVVPTEEEQTQLCTEYMCSKVAICRDIADMRQVLSPIHAEIYEKSGEKARREARR